MMIDVFGRLQYVSELNEGVDIVGDRLYIFLKERATGDKVEYEYLGSMTSTLEDTSEDFFKPFLAIATHYSIPPDEILPGEVSDLKEQLDRNDRSLVFEGRENV